MNRSIYFANMLDFAQSFKAAPCANLQALIANMAVDGAPDVFDHCIAAAALYQFNDDITTPLKIEVNADVACYGFGDVPTRSCEGVKMIYNLFDKHNDVVTGSTIHEIADSYKEYGCAGLPVEIRPLIPLPETVKLNIYLQQISEGHVRVLKQFIFIGGMTTAGAIKFVRNEYSTPVLKLNATWSMKKGLQYLLDRIEGVHVTWTGIIPPNPRRVSSTDSVAGEGGGGRSKWQPTKEQVRDGIAFIKDTLPPDTEELEQHEWSLVNRLADPESKIFGWPADEVQKAVRRLNTMRGDAEAEYFFPLLAKDLKDVIYKEMLPRMLPYAKTKGLIVAGWPGVGKTQFVKIWSFILTRYWQHAKQITNRKPCVRRGKKIERFKGKPQEIIEMLMSDAQK